MKERTKERTKRTNGWTEGRMDHGEMSERINKRTNERMNGRRVAQSLDSCRLDHFANIVSELKVCSLATSKIPVKSLFYTIN